MPDHVFLLEILKIIFSWPFMAVVIIGIFAEDLRVALRNGLRVKTPYGELETQQQKVEEPNARPIPTPPVPEGGTATAGTVESARAEAQLWKFRYLNYFLARQTQVLLDWFAHQATPVTLEYLQALLVDHIPYQRALMIHALEANGLIERAPDQFQITELGRRYREWRGTLPPLPPVPPPAPPA